MASELVRVQYAGFDFNTHSDEILARLQVNFAEVYNDFSVSSLGIMLIDVFSFGLDTLSFYLDRRATDNFLSTARVRSSAVRLARQLGYKAGSATASSVDVTVSLATAQIFPVTIPLGLQFRGPNGLIFEAQESVTFSAGDTSPKTITLSEGETVTASFTSDGTANQVFQVGNVPTGKFILGAGTLGISQTSVFVGPEEYIENELLLFGNTAQYELGHNDDPPTLRFGDSVAGKIPPAGSGIQLTFFATSGVSGQATTGTITKLVTPLVVGFTAVDLVINNPSGTGGGSDPETLANIKVNAPTVFKSRGVNITGEDYEARAKSFVDPIFGAIAVARAVTVRGSAEDAFLNSKLSDIRAASSDVEPTVDAAVVEITASSDAITTSITSAILNDDLLQASLTTIDTEENSVTESNNNVRVAFGVAQASSTGLATEVSKLQTQILALEAASASDGISPATKTVFDNIIAAITGRNVEIGNQVATGLADVDSMTTSLTSINSEIVAAEDLRTVVRADIDQIQVDNLAISTTAATLSSDVNDIGSAVNSLTAEISTHVDAFLSDECKSNLIEVPVLTLDSEGFYAVPTFGLQRSLQSFLDSKKEVTQVVKVVGSSALLVPANVNVEVGILTGFNEATVRSQVEAAILGVLRGRKFGVTLHLSELCAPIAPAQGCTKIDGVEYVNIEILESSGTLDAKGNLLVRNSEVVTRGTIAVTSVIVEVSALT